MPIPHAVCMGSMPLGTDDQFPCGPLQDCDGVILESSELTLRAYNAAFKHYNVRNGARD